MSMLRLVLVAPCLASRLFAPITTARTSAQPDMRFAGARWAGGPALAAQPYARGPRVGSASGAPGVPALAAVAVSASFVALAVGGGRRCAWEVSHTLAKPATGPVAEFLRREEAVEEIVLLNESVKELEPDSAGRYTAHLAPVRFPGASVRPTVRFEAVTLQDGLRMKAHDMVTKGEGPSFFMRLMESIVPDIESHTDIQAVDGITYSHKLKIEFPLPFWWPIPDNVMRRVGSKVLQSSTRKDVEATASKLRARYEEWERDHSSDMSNREMVESTSSR